MSRFALIVLGLGLTGFGFSQSTPSLTDAEAVEMKVNGISWNPDGHCLAYWKELESGTAIGFYQVGDTQGNVLLRVNKGDECNFEWFLNQEAAIATVSHTENDQKTETLYLLEAKSPTPFKLYEQTATIADNLHIDVNLSPELEHAIFNVHIGDHAFHMVLPSGGTTLIASTDLDQAEKQGYMGPKWGASGTAFYLDRKTADAIQAKPLPDSGTEEDHLFKAILDGLIAQQGHAASSGNADEDAANQAFAEGEIRSFRDRLTPAPAVGEAGLELMPDLGVLRQVGSPGPWKYMKVLEFAVGLQKTQAKVTAGSLNGKSDSLWLIAADKSWSLLAAPQAQASWLSPTGRSIAYTVDRVLFVRSLKR